MVGRSRFDRGEILIVMKRRNFLTLTGAAGLGLSAVFADKTSAKTRAKVYEYTFLKSVDAKPDALLKFIAENWFAMDKIAVKKGLMVSYSMFEVSGNAGDWNVVVAVGYSTEKGYEAIAAEFEKIRQQHKKVLIEGKDLRELGKIVGSQKFFPRTSSED